MELPRETLAAADRRTDGRVIRERLFAVTKSFHVEISYARR